MTTYFPNLTCDECGGPTTTTRATLTGNRYICPTCFAGLASESASDDEDTGS